jgi:GTPase
VNTNFIDYVKVFCRSGKGGAGSKHFRREKFIDQGGPDGGDGGRGGHIIVRGNKQMWTLLHLKYKKHIHATDGQGGYGAKCSGSNGEDIILEVPLGTVIRDFETREIECEIMDDGQEIILLPGGRGGMGNARFKTATNQAPEYAQPGGDSKEGWKVMELKVLADVGLVGFPNAGKSTLLSVVSAATPEIANYPFTTIVPQLGIVPYFDDRSFCMADLPGIIKGASEGKGLGHRFLKHIERNSVLLFIISCESDDIKKEYKILENELKKFNPELLNKPRILGISKCDNLDEELISMLTKTLPKKLPYIFFSSVTGHNIDSLKDLLWNTINEE